LGNAGIIFKEKIMALTDKVEIPRRTLVLFFIVDTSGSMEGSKIGALNTAIKVVTFETKIEDPAMKPLSAQGMMNLCIPYPVIKPVLRNKEM
jgi:flagellar motor switch protein FliM